MNKTESAKKISEFFARNSFTPEELKKIRLIAMKFGIKLGVYRKLYCKSCLSQLKGSTRISKDHRIVICTICGTPNKFKIK